MNLRDLRLSEATLRRNPHLADLPQKQGGNKFNAKRTPYNGRVYASAWEAEVSQKFDLMKLAGDITDIRYQVPFKVGEVDKYIVDFVITLAGKALEKSGYAEVAVDAKGVSTPKFRRDKRFWRTWGTMPLWIMRRHKATEIIISELLIRQKGVQNG